MQTGPDLDQKVKIRSEDGVEVTSHIKGFLVDGFVLGHPVDLPVEHPFREGAHLTLTWYAEGGRYSCPCRLSEISHRGARTWDVTVIGQTERLQRRAYVRAPVDGIVTMRWTSKLGQRRQVEARVDDLSEASLRFLTKERSVAVEEMADRPVQVRVETDGRRFDLHGKVLRVARFDPATGEIVQPGRFTDIDVWAVYVIFVDHGALADDLRRIVYRAQLDARNTAANLD